MEFEFATTWRCHSNLAGKWFLMWLTINIKEFINLPWNIYNPTIHFYWSQWQQLNKHLLIQLWRWPNHYNGYRICRNPLKNPFQICLLFWRFNEHPQKDIEMLSRRFLIFKNGNLTLSKYDKLKNKNKRGVEHSHGNREVRGSNPGRGRIFSLIRNLFLFHNFSPWTPQMLF